MMTCQILMLGQNTRGVTLASAATRLPPRGCSSTRKTEARWIARRAKTFVALGDELNKWSPSGVLMKCIPTNQGKQLLLKVHVGIYGHHTASRSLVGKAFGKVFTGPPHYEMQRRSFACVRDANSTLGKLICRHRSFKPSPSPSHSWSGAATW